jgi:peptidylprolyl isomerase
MIRTLGLVFALAVSAAIAVPALAQAPKLPAGADPQNTLVIDTTQGRIIVKLRTDLAPKHAERLKLLARDGFYNNVPWHRVMDGFMAQTGDGKNFNGTGNSKYPNLASEFTQTPFVRGVVGMARASDPNSANSQFFICLGDASFLNGQYTVIGNVLSGMDVVDKLRKAPRGSQSGAVADPDKMLKVQVAADMK